LRAAGNASGGHPDVKGGTDAIRGGPVVHFCVAQGLVNALLQDLEGFVNRQKWRYSEIGIQWGYSADMMGIDLMNLITSSLRLHHK